MNTDDAIFAQMIGQGWTLIAASDDQGATGDCVDANYVGFPASDPNIVAAGGTTLYTGPGGFSSETGWQGGTWSGACAHNDGGSGGGFSLYWSTPFYQSSLGFGSRGLPDIALNASVGENYYFNGQLSGAGGTSIVAPEIAGFFAQENSYMDYIATINGGCYGTAQCAPIGNGNWYIYYFGENPGYAPHYPFYDITSGCNSNDVTAFYVLATIVPGLAGMRSRAGARSTSSNCRGRSTPTAQLISVRRRLRSQDPPSSLVQHRPNGKLDLD